MMPKWPFEEPVNLSPYEPVSTPSWVTFVFSSFEENMYCHWRGALFVKLSKDEFLKRLIFVVSTYPN